LQGKLLQVYIFVACLQAIHGYSFNRLQGKLLQVGIFVGACLQAIHGCSCNRL
jgi:hypothetical protein